MDYEADHAPAAVRACENSFNSILKPLKILLILVQLGLHARDTGLGHGRPGPKAQALFDPLSKTVISYIALHQSRVEPIRFVPVLFSWLNKEKVEICCTPDTDTDCVAPCQRIIRCPGTMVDKGSAHSFRIPL